MGQTTLSVRIDENIKRRFDAFCADAGMNASVAVNMFVRAVLREKKIPFEVSGETDPFYSAKNLAALDESVRQLENGQTVVKDMGEGMSKLVFSEQAWAECLSWQDTGKESLIHFLLKDINLARNGHQGLGKSEPLRSRDGFFRRIDEENRLVYLLKEDRVEILQCKGHYDD